MQGVKKKRRISYRQTPEEKFYQNKYMGSTQNQLPEIIINSNPNNQNNQDGQNNLDMGNIQNTQNQLRNSFSNPRMTNRSRGPSSNLDNEDSTQPKPQRKKLGYNNSSYSLRQNRPVMYYNGMKPNQQLDNQQLENLQLGNQQFGNQQLNNQKLGNQQFGNQQSGNQNNNQQLNKQQLNNQQSGNQNNNQQLNNQQLGNMQYDNQQYDNQPYRVRRQSNMQYDNQQYDNQPYRSRKNSNPQYDNQQYDNQPYGNRQYGNQEYGNKVYGNREYDNQDYGHKNYGNQQYGVEQYENKRYGNKQEVTSKLDKIEKKMEQMEKQSLRIEAFNDVFFKLFPSSKGSSMGYPQINPVEIDRDYNNYYNQHSPRMSYAPRTKRVNRSTELESIDEEFTNLKQELGERLSRIREKQKLQTDAIKYILKHSGNSSLYSEYMNFD